MSQQPRDSGMRAMRCVERGSMSGAAACTCHAPHAASSPKKFADKILVAWKFPDYRFSAA